MRILLITSFFPPTQTAGTEKRTLGYALSLQKLGHQVQVICAGRWNEDAEYWNGYTDETYQGVPVRRVHLNWTLAPDPNRYLYENPIAQDHIIAWMMDWKPDVVHITSCVTMSAGVIQSARDLGIPVVLTLTDFWFICPRINLVRPDGSLCDGQTTASDCLSCMLAETRIYQGLRRALPLPVVMTILTAASRHPSLSRQRGLRGMALNMEHRKAYLAQLLQMADIVTAPSKIVSELVKNALPHPQTIHVIHSGHDLSQLKPLPPKTHGHPVRIGYIGQIIPVKGVHTLIAAFESADFGTGEAELVIFGDPTKEPAYFQQLEGLTKKNTAAINFAGAFPHQRLGEALAEIDVLVVPSLWHENNPRVIQEAFACRTPVIASDVGGISEFIEHDKCGLLFERGNVDDLAEQLRRVVDEPALLQRLQAGIPPVRSIEDEISEFEEIYRGLLAARAVPLPLS